MVENRERDEEVDQVPDPLAGGWGDDGFASLVEEGADFFSAGLDGFEVVLDLEESGDHHGDLFVDGEGGGWGFASHVLEFEIGVVVEEGGGDFGSS